MQTHVQPGIDAVLSEAVEAGRVPGVVGAAATGLGTLYEGAFGKRSIDRDDPMTTDTVVWIASMSKAITAVAAMQLVERGKLDLDRPIGDVLPALAKPNILEGFETDGTPKLRPATQPITLRRLLTHTAGFGYEIWSEQLLAYLEHTGTPSVISCQEAALSLPLLFEPGSAWHYGIGIDWAGKAVEAVSGQKLGAYLHDNILGPLGMRDTVFRIGPAQRRRLSGMHARTPDGLVPTSFEVEQEPEFEMGGGGLYGTAPDYILFLRMLLRDGELAGARILKPETVAAMMQNHIGDLNAGVLKTAMPQYSNDVDVFPGMKAGWGLSFIVNSEAVPGGRSAGSLAWGGLANSYYWLDPAKNVGGVILTQIIPFCDPEAVRLYGDFERAVYGFLLGENPVDPDEQPASPF